MRKVDSIHQLAAPRAWHITNLVRVGVEIQGMVGRKRCPAQHSRLLFFVRANLLERRYLDPKSTASFALAHRFRADRYRSHVNLATRTLQHGQLRGGRLNRRRATVRTILAADEHHSKARRASDGRELRFTIPALRRVGRDRGATVWTVESLRFHNCQERTHPCVRSAGILPAPVTRSPS